MRIKSHKNGTINFNKDSGILKRKSSINVYFVTTAVIAVFQFKGGDRDF